MSSRIFVIFGTQRTGTTLLATRLNSHPHITCYSEVLLPDVDSEPSLRGWLAGRGYPQFVRSFPSIRRSFLNSIIEVERPHGVDAVGLKLMYEQVSLAPKVTYAYPPAGRLLNDVGLLRWLKDHDVLVIHVLRRNHLKTVVSHVRAAQTQEFHRLNAANGRAAQITLPLRGLKARLNRLELAERTARGAIKGLRAIDVCYEDYVGNCAPDVEKRICAELGQTVPVGGLQSPLSKISSDSLPELIANYDEVVSMLTGTRYEVFLEL